MAESGNTTGEPVALSGYQPISCVNHERLEFAVLKKQWLDVNVLQGEHAGRWRLLPLDVYARDGSEWLEARDASGNAFRLRLDWVSF
jgi:Rho-binding antiterminator